MHVLHGNTWTAVSDKWQRVGRMSGKLAPRGVSRQPLTAVQRRAAIAAHTALWEELEAAGWTWGGPPEGRAALIQLYRDRLTEGAQQTVKDAVGASHVVGDDALSAGIGSAAPYEPGLLRLAQAWGGSGHHPMVVFPLHLERVKDHVHAVFQSESGVAAVTVLMKVPLSTVDMVTDFASFATVVDKSVLSGWGTGVVVTQAAAFVAHEGLPAANACPQEPSPSQDMGLELLTRMSAMAAELTAMRQELKDL